MADLPLTSDKVRLRRLRPGDLAPFQAYRNDPEVARFQSWTPMSDEGALHFLRAVAADPAFPRGGWWQIAVADPVTDTLWGDMGLYLSDDGTTAEIGITLASDAQGKGRARAAMDLACDLIWQATPAKRIQVITDARNVAALRLIRSMGLPQVDTLREDGLVEPVFEILRPAPR